MTSLNQTARLSPEVRKMLLTIQYERKMAGEPQESNSFNEIIKRALKGELQTLGIYEDAP